MKSVRSLVPGKRSMVELRLLNYGHDVLPSFRFHATASPAGRVCALRRRAARIAPTWRDSRSALPGYPEVWRPSSSASQKAKSGPCESATGRALLLQFRERVRKRLSHRSKGCLLTSRCHRGILDHFRFRWPSHGDVRCGVIPRGLLRNVGLCFFGHCFGWRRFVDPTTSILFPSFGKLAVNDCSRRLIQSLPKAFVPESRLSQHGIAPPFIAGDPPVDRVDLGGTSHVSLREDSGGAVAFGCQSLIDLHAGFRICFPQREVIIGLKNAILSGLELPRESRCLYELCDNLLLVIFDDISLDDPLAPDVPGQVCVVLR